MKKKYTRAATLLVATLVGGMVLSACGTARAYSSQCAFIIGDGVGDNRELKQIVYPNTRVSDVGDDIVKFVPCNARNYLVANRDKNRDRTTPSVAKTRPGSGANNPARQIAIYSSSYWTLNQNREALKEFIPFCEKYNCYASEDQVSGSDNFATPGWNGMLGENYGPALDRAFQRSLQEFPPNIWDERSQWPKVAETTSRYFAEELQVATGSKTPFFCSAGSDTRSVKDGGKGEKCDPPRIVIDAMQTTDGQAERQQQETANVAGQAQLNIQRRQQAEKLYGSQADYWLGLQDALQKCKETGQQCTIVVGGNGSVLPAK